MFPCVDTWQQPDRLVNASVVLARAITMVHLNTFLGWFDTF